MKDIVYYYVDGKGNHIFSTGAIRDHTHAEQYIRMLHFAKRKTILLDKDNQEDKRTIQKIFNAGYETK